MYLPSTSMSFDLNKTGKGTGLNLRGPDARRRRENFGISLNVPNSHSQKIRYQCQLEALELSKKVECSVYKLIY